MGAKHGRQGPDPGITDELTTVICEHLRQGLYRTTVANLVGIHQTTFSQWMHKEGEPYDSFQAAVLKAEAEAEQIQLAKITGSPEPADAKWYLARKAPDRWAETRRVDISGRLDLGVKLSADAINDPNARQHILGLTAFFFADGDTEPDSPGTDS